MESEAETGRTLRSRLMELLYASNGSTFTLRQLSTILAATESDIQREAEDNDFTLYNAREKSVQLKQRFTDRLKPANRSRNVMDEYEYSDEDYSHNTRDAKRRIASDNEEENKGSNKPKKKIVFNSANNNNNINISNGEFASELRQGKRTLFDFTSAAQQLSAFGDLDEAEHNTHKQEISGNETNKTYDSVYANDNRRSRMEVRSKIRNTSRRRGAVRSKSRKRAGARDEDRTAIPTGQVGRVGYVCVADEFHLAGLESHYRNLGYFTKFDFDVLHVRFADAEMQRSTSPYSRGGNMDRNMNGDNNYIHESTDYMHGNNDMNNHHYDTYQGGGGGDNDNDEHDQQQHDDEKSWNYGATALNSNRMSPLTKEHAPMPTSLYTDREAMSGRGGGGSGVSSARDRHQNRSASGSGGHNNNSSKSREGKRVNDKQVSVKDHTHLTRFHYDPNDDANTNRTFNMNKDAAVVTATVDSANDDNDDDEDEREHKRTIAHQSAYSPYDEMYNNNNNSGKNKHANTDRDDFADKNDYDHDSDLGKEIRTNVNYRGGFDLFIFEYGAVVWWGFDQRYFKIVENDFMLPDSAIAKYVINRYTTKLVNENYPVWCTYNLLRKERLEADEDFKRRLRFDHFLIPYGQGDVNTSGISMLCASHALAQSAKIDYLEIKVQELTENCSPLPRDLKEKGGVTISERRLLQLRGEVLSYRLMLKSGSDLLDEPDLFWENAYLKPVFQATKEGFEISERVEALDNKLDATNEILSILADEFAQRHGARLEWIVIWLVFVEVIIGVLELIVDSRPWFYKQ